MTMTLVIRTLAVLLLVAVTHAQDVIYYKFESGGGNKVINYVSGDPTAPREGTIRPNGALSMAWDAGKFGGALAAGAATRTLGYEVDSGWRYRIPGDLTIAFFIRVKHPLTTDAFVCGDSGQGAFLLRMLGGTSTRGWLSFVWDARTTTTFQKDILTPASVRWVHVALVVVPRTSTISLFVDGKLVASNAVSRYLYPIQSSALTFSLGERNEGYWSFDEFRLTLRAASAAEILGWATTESAAHAAFENPCHPVGRPALLQGSGGLPKIGNTAHALTVYALPQSLVALGLGSNNQLFGRAALPLDLRFLDPKLSGCFWRTSADVVLLGKIGAAGALSFPLPIPNLPSVSGARLYSQALLSSSILNATMLTNAYATVVGR